MKNSLITYLIGCFFLISCFKATCKSYTEVDTAFCTQIGGVVLNSSNEPDQNSKLEMLCSGSPVKTALPKDGENKFKFILKKNLNYIQRISTKNRIPKLISIDTKLHKDPYGMNYFLFETKLKETCDPEKSNLDEQDIPIAINHYDGSIDNFIYD
jgi:hypothetical protein